MTLTNAVLLGLLRVADALVEIETLAIILRALLSWFPSLRLPWLSRLLWVLTEPILRPLRRILPPWKTGGLDISPLVAVFLLWAIRVVVINPLKISLIYGGAP